MPRVVYTRKKFSAAHRALIDQANVICDEYDRQGLTLTLRQLYYQFVARGYLANNLQNYNKLGNVVSAARMAGELDWSYLVDRTRNLVKPNTWRDPAQLLKAVADQYATDLWGNQNHRVEVWIEKEAGIGVIESVCTANQVPFFACKGYTSASEMWEGAQRIGDHLVNGSQVTVLHIGDHDPSGLDMTRDIRERLALFLVNDWHRSAHYQSRYRSYSAHLSANQAIREDMRATIREAGGTIADSELPWRVRRIALNIDQIEEYAPPPNPAKTTDSRFAAYEEATGLHESWELDALEPTVLQNLISDEIGLCRDDDLWDDAVEQQERDRIALQALSDDWPGVRATLEAKK